MLAANVPARSLFATPEFQNSTWITRICDLIGGYVWVTNGPLVPGHFGTYFGALGIRKYDNLYIQDLYYLHELVHLRNFCFDPESDYLTWSTGIIDCEFEASLASECLAYLRIPGLREKTFPHDIWIDRHLDMVKDFPGQPHEMEVLIARERRRAMVSPHSNDFLEQQLANYARQNWIWCEIWSEPVGVGPEADQPAFRVVESHMASPDRDETHEEWLRSVSVNDSGLLRPFYRQANAFRPVFEETGRRFGNHLLSR